jgi:hypothetical protein
MGAYSQQQFFMISDGALLYCGMPIGEGLVREAQSVLEKHVTRERDPVSLYKSVLFCIASQRTEYERAVEFTQSLGGASFDELRDDRFIVEHARAAALLHSNDPLQASDPRKNRFKGAISFIDSYGGIELLAADLMVHPIETRRILNKAKCNLAPKTASFWYLCMGGRELMTLDTHNYRQLAGLLGNDEHGKPLVKPEYYEGKLRRTDGRSINTTPCMRDYEMIERKALEALQCCKALRGSDGKTDAALATALFWITGAKVKRRHNPLQMNFFGDEQLRFESPFGGI